MASSFTSLKRLRKSFGRLSEATNMPNLIEVQKASYDTFLQMDASTPREDVGLQAALKELFPVYDFNNQSQLEFVKYDFERPKYDVEECQQRGMTYAAPLKVTLRLVVWDLDEDTNAKSIRDIKEQEVFMGDIPLMTNNGTFVINGTERVVVSQMHRSPGVFFDHDRGKSHSSGKYLFASRVIPYRGSWLDFEFDAKDILHVRIDRRRKLPVTTFLMALDNEKTAEYRQKCKDEGVELSPQYMHGLSREEILNYFYKEVTYKKVGNGWSLPVDVAIEKGRKYDHDIIDAKTGEVVVEAGKMVTPRILSALEKDGVSDIWADESNLIGRFVSRDLIAESGLVLMQAGDEITPELLEMLVAEKYDAIPTLNIDNIYYGQHLRNTLAADKNLTREDALIDIYRVIRPGEPPTFESAEQLFRSLFFDNERYDLSAVGRVKMNSRLKFNEQDVPDTIRYLRKEDILEIVRVLIRLKDGEGEVDDIDHLGNRRVRSVGELMENQYRIGLLRMERAISERMSSVEIDTVLPHDLVNAKPAVAAVREFFGSSQLSQFMDQTNPLVFEQHFRQWNIRPREESERGFRVKANSDGEQINLVKEGQTIE